MKLALRIIKVAEKEGQVTELFTGNTPATNFAWECMAGAHPHEAAELNWPRFVAWVQQVAGHDVPEGTIRAALAAEPNPDLQVEVTP